jgi:TRAP-type C4-dicarboxylate transport system substrate-binding protein
MTMQTTRRILLAAGAAMAAAPTARAQAAGRWRRPTPDGNYHTRNVRAFLEEAKTATGGRVDVQVHSNGALLPMPQIKRGVQTGQVQLGEILLSPTATRTPFFEVDGLPQLVTTFAEARRLDELSRPFIEARFARQGLSLLYTVPWPPSGFYTNVPVDTLEVLRGTRMRTFNVMTNRFATLIGATPDAGAGGRDPAGLRHRRGELDGDQRGDRRGQQRLGLCALLHPCRLHLHPQRGVREPPRAGGAARRRPAGPARRRHRRPDPRLRPGRGGGDHRPGHAGARGVNVSQASPALREGMARISDEMVREWLTRAGEDGQKVIEAYRAGRAASLVRRRGAASVPGREQPRLCVRPWTCSIWRARCSPGRRCSASSP